MNLKTSIRSICAAAIVCLVFTGCGKKAAPEQVAPEQAAPEQAVSVQSSIPAAAIVELAYNAGSSRLYAASADGVVRVWDTRAGELKTSRSAAGVGEAARQEGDALYAGGELPPAADDATARTIGGAGGGLIASGYADGSVVVRDRNGTEIVRYISGEGGEWISMVPSGYFKASRNGGSLVQVQSGEDTYTMTQLSEVFRRDDVFEAILNGKEPSSPTLRELTQDNKNRAPEVEIPGEKRLTVKASGADITVRVTVREGGAGYLVVRNRENVIGLPPLDGSPRTVNGNTVYEFSLNIPLESGENDIGVSCFNANHTIESKISRIRIQADYRRGAKKPTLHVLAAAIQNYQNNRDYDNLSFTINDADKIAELFENQKTGSLYEKVRVRRLSDKEVTREGLARAFDEVGKQAEPDDVFVFFFAGHGNVDATTKDFFLVPWDTPGGKPIAKQDIISNIMKVRCQTLVMLDTCRSGALMDMQTAFGRLLEKLGQKAVLVAASGEQSAVESGALGHGVFSHVLLEKYSRAPSAGEGRYADERQLINYVKERVPEEVARMQEGGRLSGNAARGATRRDIILQEPFGWFPEQDFTLLDRYLEPGTLDISAVSAGTLAVEGSPPERLVAGGKVTKKLPEKKYTVSMLYEDGQREEHRDVQVQNNSAGEVRFSHRVAAAPAAVPAALPVASAPVSAPPPAASATLPVASAPPAARAETDASDFETRVANGAVTITKYRGSAKEVVIPAAINGLPVTAIGGGAFRSSKSLTAVTIPSSVTTIGDSAFYNCYSLTAVTIPSSVTTIGDEAFEGCTSLTAVTIPSSVTAIGDYAFSLCKSLTAVTIPSSVTTIGWSAFSRCFSLTAVTVDNRNNRYAGMDGVLFDKNMQTIIAYPGGKSGAYTIPSSVTTIRSSAFEYCSRLTVVTIPSSVTTIGDRAFSYCHSLTAVTIPSSVTTIGRSAFVYCYSLTAVTIPSSVTTIGKSAFYDCKNLNPDTRSEITRRFGTKPFEL